MQASRTAVSSCCNTCMNCPSEMPSRYMMIRCGLNPPVLLQNIISSSCTMLLISCTISCLEYTSQSLWKGCGNTYCYISNKDKQIWKISINTLYLSFCLSIRSQSEFKQLILALVVSGLRKLILQRNQEIIIMYGFCCNLPMLLYTHSSGVARRVRIHRTNDSCDRGFFVVTRWRMSHVHAKEYHRLVKYLTRTNDVFTD